jgi:hypothetical protein
MPTNKEMQVYAQNMINLCDKELAKLYAERSDLINDSKHQPDYASEDRLRSIIQPLIDDFEKAKNRAKALKEKPDGNTYMTCFKTHQNIISTAQADKQDVRALKFETILEARERHLKNINSAIQDLERRLINAGAKPTDIENENPLNTALQKVQELKQAAASVQPQKDESMNSFASQCNEFITLTPQNDQTSEPSFADYQTSFDQLVECINPLLEYLGYEPYKTTSFRNTLQHMKGETESIQDQEQVDNKDKLQPPEI